MTPPVRLGQRVYGVNREGSIVPTLVKEIEIIDDSTDKSIFANTSGKLIRGSKYEANTRFRFRVLYGGLIHVRLSFDEAYESALAVLAARLQDESISVALANTLNSRRAEMINRKEEARSVADSVDIFAETDRLGLLSINEADKIRTQADFPKFYIEPGTLVWIADTSNWQLIKGMVTEVYFAPTSKRNLGYFCGRFSRQDVEAVFRTKKGALNYLETQFKMKLPGTIDRKRVLTVFQLSESERKRLQMENIETVADQMHKAGYFKGL